MLVSRLIRCDRGSTAAEFAMTLPLVILLLFGIIDAGRLAWEFNRAEKATQVGARVAVVTNSFPSGLLTADYLGQTIGGVTLTQGDRIPAAALGDLQCTRTACTCVTAPCPSTPGTISTTTFDNVLLPRMQSMNPRIQASNVEVHYTGSGLGYAGDPNGMQIAPTVTVKVTGMTYRPITALLFANFTLPDFSTSLTAEDASGTQSN
jgi:Flp pilus assembly protein TadG